MNRKIDLYEEIRVIDDCEDPELRGKIGVVMGISEENGVVYGYSVRFADLEHSYGFSVEEVESTGRKFKHEDFYDGTSISVSKDGKLL